MVKHIYLSDILYDVVAWLWLVDGLKRRTSLTNDDRRGAKPDAKCKGRERLCYRNATLRTQNGKIPPWALTVNDLRRLPLHSSKPNE